MSRRKKQVVTVRSLVRTPWGVPGQETIVEDSSMVQHHLATGALVLVVPLENPPIEEPEPEPEPEPEE